MTDQIRARFGRLGNFPSPPAVAQDILKLARDPDVSVADVAKVIGRDPALAAKIMRVASSPLYAQRRACQTLRQALTVLGVDTVMTLCLGFSITAGFRGRKSGAVDAPAYWRRSLLGALGARCLAEAAGIDGAEEAFLAGLLADLGILAIDRAQPEFYRALPPDASHAERVAHERAALEGEDHATLGAWLYETWQLPAVLVGAVRMSHADDAGTDPADRLNRCVRLGARLADALLAPDRAEQLRPCAEWAATSLGIAEVPFTDALTRLAALSHDIGAVFDTPLLDAEEALSLVEEAQALLADRHADVVAERDALRDATQELTAHSAALADANRRDSLTGVYNRGHFDERVLAEFTPASRDGSALALLFVDLDHFKRINDTHGHQAGDAVLKSAAALLARTLRAQDLLARYGGEEFVVLLPGLGPREAVTLGQRMLAALRASPHAFSGNEVVVTASIGLAVHTVESRFDDAAALIAAADGACYQAKRAGRNRLVAHGTARPVGIAQAG